MEEYVTPRRTTWCRYRRGGSTSAEQHGRAGPGGVGEGALALLLASVVREGWSWPLSAAALTRASIAAHLGKSVKLTLRHGCKRGSMVVGEGVRTRELAMPLSDFGAQVSCPCPSPGQCWRAGWHGYGKVGPNDRRGLEPVLLLPRYHRQESWSCSSPGQCRRAGPGSTDVGEHVIWPTQLPPRLRFE